MRVGSRLAGTGTSWTCCHDPRTRTTHARRDCRTGPSARLRPIVGRRPDLCPQPGASSVHRRAGLALFGDTDAMPVLLAELLNRRLEGVSGAAWAVLRALGLAERPLSPAVLGPTAGLAHPELTNELRALEARRLLRTAADDRVELRHPLLAEAVRRRVVAGEGAPTHRCLAAALGDHSGATAAEIAERWHRGNRPEQEIRWRIAAARSVPVTLRPGAGGRALAADTRHLAGLGGRPRRPGCDQVDRLPRGGGCAEGVLPGGAGRGDDSRRGRGPGRDRRADAC